MQAVTVAGEAWAGSAAAAAKSARADERWLAGARAGDPAAFEGLVKRHERMVFSLALHVVRRRATAEDIAQEVFLQLFRSLGQIQSDAHLVFWLRRVTSHRAIDWVRRDGGRVQVELEDGSVTGIARRDRDPFLAGELRRLVGRLPVKHRTVVVLRYQEDLEPTEIAELLDLPLNTVKSQLKRALASLRARAARLKDGR